MTEGHTMVRVNLRWLISDQDRHGTTRYYVRKPGAKKIRIRAQPGSEEFAKAYHAAIGGDVKPTLGPVKYSSESMTYLCNQYFASTMFKVEISPGTQKARRQILNKLCEKVGRLPYAKLEARHIHDWMDARTDHPEAANNLLKSLRGLFAFAVARRLVEKDPSAGIKKIRTYSEGNHTWTVAEFRQYEARWPVGTTQRLAFALLAFTGQRISDAVLMGHQHVENGLLRVLRQKTKRRDKKVAYLPILPELQAVIAATPLQGMTFLIGQHGRPYTPDTLSNLFRKWCDAAGLPHCSAHGIRKAAATIAAENGATDRQLMAIFGWRKADMATLYTEQAEQKRLAQAAMGTLVPGTAQER